MATVDSSWRKRILGYANRLTARPGERIEFKISVEGADNYSAQLVRLVNGDIYSGAASFKEIELESIVNGRHKGRQQSVAPGSCVVVEDATRMEPRDEITIVINVMPTAVLRGTQHVISRWDESARAGWSLHLDEGGRLAFIATDGRGAASSIVIEQPLRLKTWYAAALRINWRTRAARLNCSEIGTPPYGVDAMSGSSRTDQLGAHPSVRCALMMAAAFGGCDSSGRVIPVGCFNGRLEAAAIYGRVLSDDELSKLMAGQRPASLHPDLLADWDFSDGISGTQVRDRSPSKLHGYIHNSPLRGVKGSRWSGSTMEWPHAPDQYAAIHFHDDDLYDCGWLTDIDYQVPRDMRSGIYALRLRRSEESESPLIDEEYVPFFVAAPRDAPQAKIAFLAPTYTYVAYGNNRRFEPARKRSGLPADEFYATCNTGPGSMQYGMLAEEHRELGLSLYDCHTDGSPVHFSSWLRPLFNMRPKSILWTFCADLLLIDWLEAKNFDYDVITDDLLQKEGVDLLSSYKVVITGNHPEYSTTEHLNAIESYLDRGGRLMYMGGNGFYWRTAVHESLVEVRRGRTGTAIWQSEVGESCLALTGEMGGIWRDLGRPPQRLFGVGFIAEGEDPSYYRIVPEARHGRAAFILEGVRDDVIGDFGIFAGYAAGQEIDKTNANHGTPGNAVVLARSENHGLRMLYAIEEMRSVTPVIDLYRPLTCAEVVFFETRNGGAVFSVGSMAWCGSLSHNDYDNSISRITANVVTRFADGN